MSQSTYREPPTVRAGDSVIWRIDLPEYPASAGWTLSYTLVKAGARITLQSVAEGDAHKIAVTPSVSGAWIAGIYHWQARVSNGADAFTVRTGTLEVEANFAVVSVSGLDARNHAQRTLDALEAWIEGRDLGVAEYDIAGRSLKTIPIQDLLLLRDRYRREVRQAARKSGRVYLRF